MLSASHQAASSAYRVIFGTGREPSQKDLDTLTQAGLKRAYRRRALDCHPDRAHTHERCPQIMAREFSKLSGAYGLLQGYVRSALASNASRGAGASAAAGKAQEQQFWRGPVPRRALPLGEFLFYTRRINWRALQSALAWQRRDRPSFGAMARQWGLLSQHRLEKVIRCTKPGEKIAAAAVRLGHMNKEQATALLRMQQSSQRPLGAYLVALRAVSNQDLSYQLRAHRNHNVGVRRVPGT